MSPADARLLAAALYGAIRDGQCQAITVRRIIDAFAHAGTPLPEDFGQRAVPVRERHAVELATEPPVPRRSVERPIPTAADLTRAEQDGLLFQLVLHQERPDLAARASCSFFAKHSGAWSAQRLGARVAVRFGPQAAADPVAAVQAAIPAIEQLAFDKTHAVRLEESKL